MNSRDPQYSQQSWSGSPASGGRPTGGWGAPHTAPQPTGVPTGPPPTGGLPTGGPGWPSPPAGARSATPQLPTLLLGLSVVAGIVAYFMGFVSWISLSVGPNAEAEAEQWAQRLDQGGGGIPAFLSYEIVLNPGKFLIVLGAIAVASGLMLVPRYRRAIPLVAVLGAAAWLALFAAALTLPPFLDLGAGAILSLIFGFLQVVLLIVVSVLNGLRGR